MPCLCLLVLKLEISTVALPVPARDDKKANEKLVDRLTN